MSSDNSEDEVTNMKSAEFAGILNCWIIENGRVNYIRTMEFHCYRNSV